MTTYNTGHGDLGIALIFGLLAVAIVLSAVAKPQDSPKTFPAKISCESYKGQDVRDLPVDCLSYWATKPPQKEYQP